MREGPLGGLTPRAEIEKSQKVSDTHRNDVSPLTQGLRYRAAYDGTLYSVSQPPPPTVFWNLSPNGWEFLINFLHTYYTIISTLDYKFLFKYLQLW